MCTVSLPSCLTILELQELHYQSHLDNFLKALETETERSHNSVALHRLFEWCHLHIFHRWQFTSIQTASHKTHVVADFRPLLGDGLVRCCSGRGLFPPVQSR